MHRRLLTLLTLAAVAGREVNPLTHEDLERLRSLGYVQ